MSEFKEAAAIGCGIVVLYAVIGVSLLAGAVWIVKSIWGA